MNSRKQSLSSQHSFSSSNRGFVPGSDGHPSGNIGPLADTLISDSEIAQRIVEAAIDQKGLDVRALDLRGISDVADYFVLISGTSERHVKGIVDRIQRSLLEQGEKSNSITGYDSGEWVLLDFGNVVAHVFYEPTRQYYEFDELWKRGTPLALKPELEVQVRRLRTGMFP